MYMKNQLKQGQVFKNYRELCKYLGWEYISYLKLEQLNYLSRKCEWHKVGHKIYIDKMKPIPMF